MSTELPGRKSILRINSHITIVASTYNEKYTTALLENCVAELRVVAPSAQVEVLRVPGAFEVPMAVSRAISGVPSNRRPDVVIALGVILRGSTAHADLIGGAVTEKLLSIACETLVPVIHEVLLLDNEEQAFARCVASALNRGREAARAAAEMASFCDVFDTTHASSKKA